MSEHLMIHLHQFELPQTQAEEQALEPGEVQAVLLPVPPEQLLDVELLLLLQDGAPRQRRARGVMVLCQQVAVVLTAGPGLVLGLVVMGVMVVVVMGVFLVVMVLLLLVTAVTLVKQKRE